MKKKQLINRQNQQEIQIFLKWYFFVGFGDFPSEIHSGFQDVLKDKYVFLMDRVNEFAVELCDKLRVGLY